jgi:hypothetical protein
MALSILFRTNKHTQETQIVGQTTAEGNDLDNIKRNLAKDGGAIGKDSQGDFKSSTYLVESFEKDSVKSALGYTIDLDNQD